MRKSTTFHNNSVPSSKIILSALLLQRCFRGQDMHKEIERQRDGQQEGQHIAHGLTDLHAEQSQHAGQNQNQGNEENTVSRSTNHSANT